MHVSHVSISHDCFGYVCSSKAYQTDNLFQPLISFDLFEHQGERFKRDKMIVMFKGHLFARGTV